MIFPMMKLFGIDQHEASERSSKSNSNWFAVREFFTEKIPAVRRVRKKQTDSGPDKLYAAILDEAIETLQRQLAEMPFFSSILEGKEINEEYQSMDNEIKLLHAPISNLGCESEIAWLDNRLKFSGGTTTITTLSRKNVVSMNRFLVDDYFQNATDEERRQRWKWARTSEQVKQVQKLNADFLAILKALERLSSIKKENLRNRKSKRLFKIVDIL